MRDRIHDWCFGNGRSLDGGFPARQDRSRRASVLSIIIGDWRCNPPCGSRFVLVKLYHCVGIGINDRVSIGDGCTIRQGVTIGNKLGRDGGSAPPTVGPRGESGAGSIVIGDISIDDDAKVGAEAVLNRNVARDAVVADNPAREVARDAQRI